MVAKFMLGFRKLIRTGTMKSPCVGILKGLIGDLLDWFQFDTSMSCVHVTPLSELESPKKLVRSDCVTANFA